jgi:hypothetical protein
MLESVPPGSALLFISFDMPSAFLASCFYTNDQYRSTTIRVMIFLHNVCLFSVHGDARWRCWARSRRLSAATVDGSRLWMVCVPLASIATCQAVFQCTGSKPSSPFTLSSTGVKRFLQVTPVARDTNVSAAIPLRIE